MNERSASIQVRVSYAISGDGRAGMVRVLAPHVADVWLLASSECGRVDQLVEYRPGMILGRRRR